jgi:hypothetical protein
MKRGVLVMLIALPLASVLMGAITFYLAAADPDPVIEHREPALGKTSWRDDLPEEVRGQ